MKHISSIIAFTSILGASSLAHASPYSTHKVETSEFTSQGGAGDVAADSRNPINMARSTHADFGRYSATSEQSKLVKKRGVSFGAYALGIHGNFSPSDVDSAFDAVGDAGELLGEFDVMNPLGQLYSLYAFNSDSLPLRLDTSMRTDFVKFRLGTPRIGTFTLGAYSQAEFGAELGRMPQITLDNIVITGGPTIEDIEGIDSIEDLEDFDFDSIEPIDGYIDLGKSYSLLKARGYIDLGTSLGWGNVWRTRAYGTVFETGFGVQARYFHRWRINDPQVTVDQIVRDENDIHRTGFSSEEGDGGAIDVYYSLRLLSSPFDPTFAVAVENMGATNYESGVEPEMPRVGMGMTIHPLGGLKSKWGYAWTLAGDLDNLQYGIPTIQVGTSYRIEKNGFGIVPRIGLFAFQRDIFGEPKHGVTAGGSLLLRDYSLNVAYARDSNDADLLLIGGELRFK